MQIQNKNIQDWILDYNNDYEVKLLRSKYNRSSFFEMMAKDRSETVHSAFISWLLKGAEFNLCCEDSPLLSFLGTLVHRDTQQQSLIPMSLRKAIVAKTLKIDSVQTECEYPVKKLAQEKLQANKNWTDEDKKEFAKIVNKSKDRIDILVNCDIQKCDQYKHLQIIIENKVGSSEGMSKKDNRTGDESYDNAEQTSRYYIASKIDDCSADVAQLFVYLTPLASCELDNYSDLDEQKKCSDYQHYIQVNYQDILDNVICPLLWSDNLSDRLRVLLNEYIETLTIPSLTQVGDEKSDVSNLKRLIVMASREEDRQQLLSFLNKYKDLIKWATLVANPQLEIDEQPNNCMGIFGGLSPLEKQNLGERFGSTIKSIDKFVHLFEYTKSLSDFCNTKDFYRPLLEDCSESKLADIIKAQLNPWESIIDELTQDKLNDIFGMGVVRIGGRKKHVISYDNPKSNNKPITLQYTKITPKKKGSTISLTPLLTLEELLQNPELFDIDLLYKFYLQNSRLIVAAMKILVESTNNNADLIIWQDLYEGLTTNQDRTKYKVSVSGKESETYLNKREVVKFIVENIDNLKQLTSNLNQQIKRMFLTFSASDEQSFDRSRYFGMRLDTTTNHYKCFPLKDNKQYDMYVTNQWGISPLRDNDKGEHPSGVGGDFGALWDFFINNSEYQVQITPQARQ